MFNYLMVKHIPNFITSLNLVSGFIAIIFILNGNITIASWLILAAMAFDFLDGFASRLLKAYSDLGKELDSLADLVSFGVAPALIIYHLLYNAAVPVSTENPSVSAGTTVLFTLVTSLMPVCAGLRLAKFNIDTTQSTSFKGLPTPANALAVVSVVIAGRFASSAIISSFLTSPVAIIIFSLVLSILMVTRIPLLALKFKTIKLRENAGKYILILVCLAILLIFGIGGIPWIIPAYILVSLLSLFF
jgi:CDP-diacylglycerol--serine O-phosphatidyltransferase